MVPLYYISSGSEEMEAEFEETQAWRGRENDAILQCSIIVKKLFYNTPGIGIFEYPFFPPQ